MTGNARLVLSFETPYSIHYQCSLPVHMYLGKCHFDTLPSITSTITYTSVYRGLFYLNARHISYTSSIQKEVDLPVTCSAQAANKHTTKRMLPEKRKHKLSS